jgi:hypothetical protein
MLPHKMTPEPRFPRSQSKLRLQVPLVVQEVSTKMPRVALKSKPQLEIPPILTNPQHRPTSASTTGSRVPPLPSPHDPEQSSTQRLKTPDLDPKLRQQLQAVLAAAISPATAGCSSAATAPDSNIFRHPARSTRPTRMLGARGSWRTGRRWPRCGRRSSRCSPMPAPSFDLPAYRGGVGVGGSRASVPEKYGGGESAKGAAVRPRSVKEHDRPCAHVALGSGPA